MAPILRRLPERKNALLIESVPEHEELVSRRRLGQTQLSSRLVAVSPSSNAERSTVTAFDYAHLRAPLPKGIVSGIFKPSPNSYFLMRRSSDGYVSATGMFRATFPYSELEEEEEERKYIKSLPTTSPEETAGNIWVPPTDALALAEDYNILPWIRALLDAADIPVSGPPAADGSPSKKIAPPPKFVLSQSQPTLVPPTPTRRSRRSVSPTKTMGSTTSKRAIASPRKRSTKTAAAAAAAAASQETSVASTESTPAPQAAGLTNGDAKDVLPSVEEEEPAKAKKEKKHGKKKSVDAGADKKVFTAGLDEVLFAGQPPSAEESARLLAEAKEMVKETVKETVAPAAAEVVEAAVPSSKKGKRKAEEDIKDEEAKENTGEGATTEQPRSKKAKTDVQIRKERVRNRTLLGISATVAIGALVPYVMGML
ncbi:hypothetical protein SCUCBS95973_001307 [Sporothrix curviconia]|uniref:HTH APSES-type domain-containing protein n=1 Tax=Sporothrix curviconia TaxID=1260050 RepID=A0ABP0AXH7_9PEZI